MRPSHKFTFVCMFFAMIIIIAHVQSQSIIDKDGHPHAKRHGRTQEPKIIIDTLRMVDGYGVLVLSDTFKKNERVTKPTDPGRIYAKGVTQILNDTTEAVYTYAFALSSRADTLWVKSSNSSDDSKIVVEFMIK